MTPETAALHTDNLARLFAHTCWREPHRRSVVAAYVMALGYRALDLWERHVRDLRNVRRAAW